jgi:uncharacterized protein with PQ loop repeat
VATELIGWVSSVVLLMTIGRQVLTQWRTKSSAGLSRWLFLGQLSASTGFTIYSILLANWVFVVTNVALLVTAICGQVIYVRNRKRPGSVTEPAAHP